MQTLMTEIIRSVSKELERIDLVEGLVVFGSYARGEVDRYSDLDMIVYISDSTGESPDFEAVRSAILRIAGRADGGLLMSFGRYDKTITYTMRHLLSVELRIKNLRDLAEDIIFIKESRVSVPEKSIILDRHGLVAEGYRKSWDQVRTDDIHTKFDEHLYGFLYYYVGFRTQLARGDAYRAYMNYTIALYKLASLCAISEGEKTNLYQPWLLIEKVMKSKNDVDLLVRSPPTMSLLDMWERKDSMIELFMRVVTEAHKRFDLNVNVSLVRELLEKVNDKYSNPGGVTDEGNG